MSDLIRREDALKAIWDWCCNREYAYTNATYWLQKRIESIPSAERKGEWVSDYSSPVAYRCTACNTLQHWSVIQNGRYRYCPNCGAHMKGADDEDN